MRLMEHLDCCPMAMGDMHADVKMTFAHNTAAMAARLSVVCAT